MTNLRNLGFGAGSGAVSALMFAMIAKGSLLSLLLYATAPLPILIAAIGFTHKAGLVAALTATLAVSLIFSPVAGLTYALGIAVPAWNFGLLVNLARLHNGKTEWYPVSRILIWIIAVSALLTFAGCRFIADDYQSFVAVFAQFADAFEAVDPNLFAGLDDAARANAIESFSAMMAVVIPPLSAAMTITSFVALIYLAARIVKASGLLPRPWPDLARIALPRSAVILFAASLIGGILLPAYYGLVARIIFSSLAMGFCLEGLAFVHFISRPVKARRAVLATLYFTFIALPIWPIIGFACVGIADAWFSLKERRANDAPSNYPNPNQDA